MSSDRRLKVVTILGTRPEVIRLSRITAALDQFTRHVIVHTGQNYDYELNQIFYDDLQLRKPDHFLEIETQSVGQALGSILTHTERVLLDEAPDAVVILGDTNSSMAGVMARRMQIPLYHLEAGNRSFDDNVPEETNRRIVDHIADFNLVYTEHARQNLLREGIPARRISIMGSPMFEVLEHYRSSIDASDVLQRLELNPQGYLLASLHRAENVDHPPVLRQLLEALSKLAESLEVPVVLSTHPRTRRRIEAIDYQDPSGRLRFLKPFGFCDYNHLQLHALCCVSDSGTISEESAILGFPAVTLRQAIERPEALDQGSIVLGGIDPNRIIDCVHTVVEQARAGYRPQPPAAYQVADVSQRVLRLILGTAGLAHRWQGIQPRPR